MRPTLRALALALVVPIVAASPTRGAESSSVGPARAGAPGPAELEALQRVIAARRERLRAYEARERGLLETLEEIDRAAADLASELTRAERALGAAKSAATRAESAVRKAEARREATRYAMSARAVALYKMGDVGPLRALFSAASLRELVVRAQRLQILLTRDAALLQRFRADETSLAQAQLAVQGAILERDRAEASVAAGAGALESEREGRRALLADLRLDRARERAGLDELEAAARALESKLDDLRAAPSAPGPQRPSGVPFASLRGRLAPPVDAPIARAFGRLVDTEFRTETFRKGVDFQVELGQEVRAVADGEVRYAGWFRGYGKLVILDHGDQWFSVAGHLGELRVEVGDVVHAADAIGNAGDTGSLAGALLYFEIRQGSEPVDPAEWLAKSRKLD